MTIIGEKFEVERKYVDPKITGRSLIGVGSKRPVPWGNYFWLNEGRVVNMWAENLEHLVNTGILDNNIEVLVYTIDDYSWVLIIDKRVPPEYLYNKLNFTGSRRPSVEIAEHIFSIIGDPTNEIELWLDPVEYYKKRGSEYNPKTGIITTKINSKS